MTAPRQHVLTEERCRVGDPDRFGEVHTGKCRRCSFCNRWFDAATALSSCPGPAEPAAQEPDPVEQPSACPDPEEVERLLRADRGKIPSHVWLAASAWLRGREAVKITWGAMCSVCHAPANETHALCPEHLPKQQSPSIAQVIEACGAVYGDIWLEIDPSEARVVSTQPASLWNQQLSNTGPLVRTYSKAKNADRALRQLYSDAIAKLQQQAREANEKLRKLKVEP